MNTIERAARDYVAARIRLAGADNAGLMEAAVLVAEAFHELHVACGEDFPDCCDDEVSEVHYASGRTVVTEKPL
jgi:hypothetical protein